MSQTISRSISRGTSRTAGQTPGGSSEAGRQLAELALQLGRLTYGDYAADGLTPAQWTALRYFAMANRFSRTVSGFAEFHATTRGTASQTVKSLVARGFLRRTPSERDGRSIRFDLTPAARRQLDKDPFEIIVRAAAVLPPVQQARTVAALQSLLEELAGTRQRELPGRCALCGHLGDGEGAQTFRCRLLDEPLVASELEELCVRFTVRS